MTQEHFGLISGLLVVFLTAIWPMLISLKPPKNVQTHGRSIPVQQLDESLSPKAGPLSNEATNPESKVNDVRQPDKMIEATTEAELQSGPALGGP